MRGLRRASPLAGQPQTILVARDVAEALAVVPRLRPDQVLFRTMPEDLDGLVRLPRGLVVHLPFEEDCLRPFRGVRCRITVRVSCSPGNGAAGSAERLKLLLGLSRAGLESTIDDVDHLTPGEALAVVRLFLRDPGITKRIDPLAAILRRLMRREAASLWAILGPDPSARVFVTPDGCVGAIPDAVGPGCAVPEFAAWWRLSEAGRAVDDFLFSLPQHNPDCLACPFFYVCEGYGAWRGTCKTWREVLAALARAGHELRHVS